MSTELVFDAAYNNPLAPFVDKPESLPVEPTTAEALRIGLIALLHEAALPPELIESVPGLAGEADYTPISLAKAATPRHALSFEQARQTLLAQAEFAPHEPVVVSEETHESLEIWASDVAQILRARGTHSTQKIDGHPDAETPETILFHNIHKQAALYLELFASELTEESKHRYLQHVAEQASGKGLRNIEVLCKLQSRFGLDSRTAEALTSNTLKIPKYTMFNIAQGIGDLYKFSDMKNRKTLLGLVLAQAVITGAIRKWVPRQFAQALSGSSFSIGEYGEYVGAEAGSMVAFHGFDVLWRKPIMESCSGLSEKIHKASKAPHHLSHADFVTLDNNARTAAEKIWVSTKNIIEDVAGVAGALSVVSAINPIMGAVSAGTTILMSRVIRNHNRKLYVLREQEAQKERENAEEWEQNSKLREDILASPRSQEFHDAEIANLKEYHGLSRLRYMREAVGRFKSSTTYYLGMMATACTGYWATEPLMPPMSKTEIVSALLATGVATGSATSFLRSIETLPAQLQHITRAKTTLEGLQTENSSEVKTDEQVKMSQLPNLDLGIHHIAYGDGILYDLSLHIPQGTFLAIEGISGSGKTTLFKLITNEFQPHEGAITVGGVDINWLISKGPDSRTAHTWICRQKPEFSNRESVRDNLCLFAVDPKQISDDYLRKTLKNLGLQKFATGLNKKLKYSSVGEAWRLAFARAKVAAESAGGCGILLLDEPTASLDKASRKIMQKELHDLHKKYQGRLTIVLITHDEALLKYAKRVNHCEVVNLTTINQTAKLLENPDLHRTNSLRARGVLPSLHNPYLFAPPNATRQGKPHGSV